MSRAVQRRVHAMGVYCDRKNCPQRGLDAGRGFQTGLFYGGALVTSKQVNGVFSHVATTETVYDKDIGHCLSRTGLVHSKAGLVDSMRKARGKGEVVNRAVSSSTQRGVAAAAVGTSTPRGCTVSVSQRPRAYSNSTAHSSIYGPGVSFRRLCGVRPARRRRFRSAFDSHGASFEFAQRKPRLTRWRVPLFA